ncbi:MAG: hypothetical protein K6G63_06040, partial [Eubacterium sp.]|nr:hypothetical protein [Eubacterium sp.]
MKQIIKIIIVYTLFACACLGIFFFTHKEQTYKGRDLTKYNDQLYNIYSEYNKGVNIPQIEEKYHCKIIMTKELVEARISKYYENSSLVLDFSPNGNYMGKIVWDDKTDDYSRFRDKILYDSFIFWAMVFVLGYIL